MKNLKYLKSYQITSSYYLIPILLFHILLSISYAQNIPVNRTTEWNTAGYEGDIPCLSVLRNVVTEFSIDNTGATDVTTAVQTALNTIKNNEVLYFPAGTYLFNNTVNVPSYRVIRGESPSLTIFNFNMGGNEDMFSMVGTVGSDIVISAIAPQGGNTITVASTSGLAVGDDIEIEQANDPALHYTSSAWNVSWGQNLKGQILKIAAINGNQITTDRTLTFEYDIAFAMNLRKITPKTQIGFENFRINRMDADVGLANNNFNFLYVNNCWIRRVHSYNTARYHIRMDNSRNIEIRECDIEMADDCGGSGAGYGALTEKHTGDCLIENNIFHDIRHPLITKEGTSRNVYAYNYSFNIRNNATCDSDPSAPYADISIHGHYSAFNLFEGNIAGRITVTDYWGPAGPCNTFMRNRVNTANGVWIQDYSQNQNFLGNEIIAPAIFNANKDNTITGTLLVANNVQGVLDFTANSPLENSMYLTSKPAFFGNLPWPSIGGSNSPNTGTIPAKARWEAGEPIPTNQLCSACSVPNLGDTKSLCGASAVTLKSNISATNRTFAWYKGMTLLTSKTTQDISVSEAGTYKVVADSLGCINSGQVTVSSVLVCNLGSDFNLCNPSVKMLDAGNADVPNVTYLWSSGETTRTKNVIAAGTYTVTVSATGCPAVNDAVAATSDLLLATGDSLTTAGVANLSVIGTSTYKWYDAITNGTLLNTGSTYNPTVNATTLFYVEDANGVTFNIGNTGIFSANGYYNADNTVRYYFNVLRDLTIDEISVNTKAAQTVVINFYNASGTLIKSASQAVGAGDQVISINIALTVANGYYIDMTGTTGQLWRDKANGAFPYIQTGIIEIKETFPTWIATNEYYAFWYNWKITAGNSCKRTAVMASVDGITSSLQNENADDGFRIYPNPVKQSLVISSKSFVNSIVISNSLGQVVYHEKFNNEAFGQNSEIRINLAEISAGIYFVKVQENNNSQVKKMIIAK